MKYNKIVYYSGFFYILHKQEKLLQCTNFLKKNTCARSPESPYPCLMFLIYHEWSILIENLFLSDRCVLILISLTVSAKL